jgi:succinate-acetate transporter protein
MAVGNTFGATALSSYGGFWIGTAIILTPGGFNIVSDLEAKSPYPFLNSFGLYLMGWFIFTFILLICTIRSTVAFFMLFLTLDLAFLLLGIGYLENSTGAPNVGCIKAGGVFGLLAAFLAWYVFDVPLTTKTIVTNRTITGTTLSLVLPTRATHSSSFLSLTSPGPTRAAKSARRWTTARRVPLSLFK